MAIVKDDRIKGTPLAYSPEGAGEMLALPRTKIYELMKTGELRFVKSGRRTLISAKELDRYAARLFGESE